jgi:hypothetical protein
MFISGQSCETPPQAGVFHFEPEVMHTSARNVGHIGR